MNITNKTEKTLQQAEKSRRLKKYQGKKAKLITNTATSSEVYDDKNKRTSLLEVITDELFLSSSLNSSVDDNSEQSREKGLVKMEESCENLSKLSDDMPVNSDSSDTCREKKQHTNALRQMLRGSKVIKKRKDKMKKKKDGKRKITGKSQSKSKKLEKKVKVNKALSTTEDEVSDPGDPEVKVAKAIIKQQQGEVEDDENSYRRLTQVTEDTKASEIYFRSVSYVLPLFICCHWFCGFRCP